MIYKSGSRLNPLGNYALVDNKQEIHLANENDYESITLHYKSI